MYNWICRLTDQLDDFCRLIIFRFRTKSQVKICVAFMSRDRLRYFKYYRSSDDRNYIVLFKANRWSIALAAKLFSIYDSEWLFSDLDGATYEVAHRILEKPIVLLSWNGVAEIEDFRSKFPRLKVKSVICDVGAIRIKPRFKFQLRKKLNHKGPQRIFFAGQLKDPSFFLTTCSLPLVAQDIVASAPALFTMLDIYSYVNNLAGNMNLTLSDKDFIRMALSAVMRDRYLRSLIKEFGSLVTVCGPDFDREKFQQCTRIPYLHASQIREMYQISNVALDFGSQCSFEALYPRSLEIINENPAALLQVYSKFSEDIFSGVDIPRWFKSEDEMLVCIDRALSLTDLKVMQVAAKVRDNVNSLMV